MSYKMILVSHGKYAKGLKHALEMIVGEQDFISAYGLMPGMNPDAVLNEIQEAISEEDTVVFLSDIVGGSMHNALVPLVNNENVFLIGGINLAMAIQVALTKPTNAVDLDNAINDSKNSFVRIVIEDSDDDDEFF